MQKAINWKRLNISRLDSASTLLLLLLTSVLSQAKWVFIPSGQACRLDPRERKSGPVLKSSDGPATKTPRPVPEVKEQPVSKDSLQTIIALLQIHSLLLFMCGDTCIFQLQQDNFKSFPQYLPANFLNGSLPVGPWWRLVVASLYIHTRAPRLEDNAEAAPSIPTISLIPRICISMTHREPGPVCILMTISFSFSTSSYLYQYLVSNLCLGIMSIWKSINKINKGWM